MKAKAVFIILIFILCLIPSALAERPHYLYDNAETVDAVYTEKINSFGLAVDQNTTAEIVIITIQALDHMTAEEARVHYFNDVPLDGVKGIGKTGKDNGVLILIVMDTHDWQIEVGYGLEGELTDADCGRIGRDVMVPLFKQSKYGEGLYQGMVSIAKELGYGVTPSITEPQTSEEIIEGIPNFVLILIVIAILLVFVLPSILDLDLGSSGGGSSHSGSGSSGGSSGGGFGGGSSGGGGGGGHWNLPRQEHLCPNCEREVMTPYYKKQEEQKYDGFYWLIPFLLFLCPLCDYKDRVDETPVRGESIEVRVLRLAEEEERRRKRDEEAAAQRRRNDSYHSSSSYHSPSSFGGGHSGGAGAGGRW